MNKLLNNLERKIGKYAIRNLSLYIIFGYIIGFLLLATGNNFDSPVDFIRLNPHEILHGQIWRLITWVLVPPTIDLFSTLIMLFLYYQLGTILERTWGTFRYNLYIFSGIVFTIIGAFILFFVVTAGGTDPENIAKIGIDIGKAFTTYYINLSIFLAFAVTYPNLQVLLFFVIPVKVKYMAIVYAVINIYQFIGESNYGRFTILMSILNFIVFFLGTRNYKNISPKEMYRKKVYRDATAASHGPGQAGSIITKHKCAICGRTEKDGDDLEFRFCSKCNGNYEYCNEHLFSHKHIL